MLRRSGYLVVPVLVVAVGVGVPTALALDCETDMDCAVGQFCASSGGAEVAVDCAAGSNCASSPADVTTAQCSPLPEGYCVLPADCAAGLDCVIETWTTGCDEPGADGGVPEPQPAPALITKQAGCVPEEVQAPYGTCQLPEVSCDSDLECLEGLSCLELGAGAGAGSSGSGTSTAGSAGSSAAALAEKAATRACGYQAKSCSTDADCAGGYECAEVPSYTSCSATDAPTCAVGETCDVPPDDPTCTTHYESYCYPKQQACALDAECISGWKCVEFTNAALGLAAPAWWDATGSVKSCLPPGMAALAQSAYGIDGFAARVGPLPGSGADLGNAAGGGNGGPKDESADGSAAVGNGAGRCSVGFVGERGAGAWAFAFGLLALVARRRRRLG